MRKDEMEAQLKRARHERDAMAATIAAIDRHHAFVCGGSRSIVYQLSGLSKILQAYPAALLAARDTEIRRKAIEEVASYFDVGEGRESVLGNEIRSLISTADSRASKGD